MITLIHNDNNKDDNSNNNDNDNDNHNNSNSNNHHSVTGWLVRWMFEILHQLRLVVYPMTSRVLAPSQVVSRLLPSIFQMDI